MGCTVRMGSQLGRAMVILLNWFQVFLGYEEHILESTKETTHIRIPWLTTLTRFLRETGIRVKVSSLWKPKKQRENDRALMDIVKNYMTDTELKEVNACRLFLGVTMMSDMASSDGKIILESIYRGRKVVIRKGKGIRYPVQTKPPREVWRKWENAMSIVAKRKSLFLPLGGVVQGSTKDTGILLHPGQ